MDNLDIVDELEVDVRRKRSMFLTVLCVLTWVGSGLLMIYHFYSYLMLAKAVKILSGISEDKTLNWVLLLHLVGMIAALFTIAGAIVMWRLKKIGFVVYAVGQLAPVLLSFYMGIYFTERTGSSEVLFSMVLPNVIPIGFLIMYATRLHEMKK